MRALALALATLAIAGCLEAAPEPAPQEPALASASPIDAPPSPRLFAFEWSNHDLRDDAGLRVQAILDEPATCHFATGLARATGRSGVTSAVAIQGPGVDAWSITGPTTSSHVHLSALLDTREEQGPGANLEARLTTVTADAGPGPVDVVLFGRDLVPWPSSLLDGASILVRLDCDRPFRLGSLQATRDFRLVDVFTLTGGLGAHVQPGASLALFDAAAATTRGDHGLFLWGSIGGAGLLSLDHPTGTERWIIDGATSRVFVAETGRYEATLERVGADFDYFFAVLAGLTDTGNLDELARLPLAGQD